jgi:membrane protein implicated in regulation of membrane protease activity
MPVPNKPSSDAGTLSAVGWSGAILAVVALIGLTYAPSLRFVWIMLLVLAVASVPQAWLALRRERRERERDDD